MPVDEDQSLEDLLTTLANVPLFIMFMRATERHDLGSPEGRELLREHLRWQLDLEERGLLLGAGPLDFGREPSPADHPLVDAWGISIIAAASREDAERIAATEPFSRHAWRETQVVSWTLNEGVAASLAQELADRARRSDPPARHP